MSEENAKRNARNVDLDSLVGTYTCRIDLLQTEPPNKNSTSHECKKSKQIEQVGLKKYAGILFTLLTSISACFAMLISKMLIQRNYPINVTFYRFQAIIICGPIFVLYMLIVRNKNVFKGIFDSRGTLILLILRGTPGLVGLCAYIYSLQYIKLGDATVILFSTPITVFLFARLFLGEPCGFVPIFAAFITLSGVIVLTRPPLLTGEKEFDSQTLIGISMAFASMLILTGLFLITRYLRKLHFSLPVIFIGYTASIESLVILLTLGIFELPRNSEDWVIMAGSALADFLGQVFLVLSLKYEAAGPVAMIRTLDIVFTFIFQMLFFGILPDTFSLVGASIIIIGIIAATFRKWLSTLPDDHSARKKYSIMLK